jgi:PAS domain S-box-containing protein
VLSKDRIKILLEREKDAALAALRESEEQFRLLVDGVRDYAIFMLGADGKVITWNSGAALLSGHPAEAIVGRHFSLLYPRESRQLARAELSVAVETGRFEGVVLRQRKDGSCFWSQTVITALHKADGSLRAFAVVMHDISELRRADEQLKASREQLRALAAKVQSAQESERIRIAREIHDKLGQVLTALHFDLSQLRRKLADQQNALTSKLETSVAEVASLLKTVQRLASELRPRALDELGLVAAIRGHVREFQVRTGIECAFRCADRDEQLTAQVATSLFRILQEALTNTARHAHASKVNVGLSRRTGQLRLTISDDGKGIPQQALEDLESLGLLGMRERAHLLGGQLQIRGTPKKGTIVRAVIPLRPSAS